MTCLGRGAADGVLVDDSNSASRLVRSVLSGDLVVGDGCGDVG